MVAFEKRKSTKTSTQNLSSYYLVRFSGVAVVSTSQMSQFDVQLACCYSLGDLSCVKTKRRQWRTSVTVLAQATSQPALDVCSD